MIFKWYHHYKSSIFFNTLLNSAPQCGEKISSKISMLESANGREKELATAKSTFWHVLQQRSARPWKYPYRKPKKAATHRQQPLCNTPRRSRSQAHFPFGRHTSVLYRTKHVSAAHNILWTKFSARIRHKAIITVIFRLLPVSKLT